MCEVPMKARRDSSMDAIADQDTGRGVAGQKG